MELAEAIATLEKFTDRDLSGTLSRIESALEGGAADTCTALLDKHHAQHDALAAASYVKTLAGQINTIVHALGILLCLPKLLKPGEVVQRVSLGAGNTGKPFDLETNRRIAEFKFINWQGGPEAIRQNSVFKDFYYLAEHNGARSKHLYVLGTKFPLKFLNGGRALTSVLSKNVALHEEIRAKYPDYRVVRDYFVPRQNQVLIEDVSSILQGFAGELQL